MCRPESCPTVSPLPSSLDQPESADSCSLSQSYRIFRSTFPDCERDTCYLELGGVHIHNLVKLPAVAELSLVDP